MASRPPLVSAADAVAGIPDGATVAITGSGGGVLEPGSLLAAAEERFLATGSPRGTTLVHALGLGDRDRLGTNAFAHEDMVRRVIGGHWTWSPRMMKLAAENLIEAYALPSGAISLLLREIGARRPGLVTRTGLHTFADPRHGGGRMNDAAAEDIVELLELDGREYLRYRPFPVDVAIVRGTEADRNGNITCRDEAALLDVRAVAQAARASGGRVLAQVKRIADDPLDPRDVVIPGTLVDAITVCPAQRQTYVAEHDPALAGPADAAFAVDLSDPVRAAVARRAAMEVPAGAVLNVGFGMSAHVVDVLAQQGRLDEVTIAIEQGLFNGVPASGDLFGMSRGASARVASTTQFDLFGMGMLDVCCLGLAQADASGSVNVSQFGGRVIGPGGFVDISQHARKAVFCGTFTAKGLRVEVGDGGIAIREEGQVPKFVDAVEQITYSGPFALREGREALFVTERAVFRLTCEGIELTEVAAGVDIDRDILPHMAFRPVIRAPRPMPAEVFRP
ncbi:acyl CoA:acetate/3-ketoacid CoA transferase [Actinomadura darangshiensis]|uniref:Acyl CoA:acetate/3-ketoacid CoA transferase n=1 Tax=Actinomadura darangshiensis TaxID=705336 RepID=A0A4R5BCS7_9ACTN|nr:CoA-transferase [Actinomadura darangshiensis]TDD83049.1 acyl CoA:acetate/3-ketoacid CoA transferase [Actinomadura darangshiensis]